MSRGMAVVAGAIGGILLLGLALAGGWTILTSSVAATETEAQPLSESARFSDSGGVQIQVEFVAGEGAPGQIEFRITLNTHSVDLSRFDLNQLSRVSLDPGGDLDDLTWSPESDSSAHHLSGRLSGSDPTGLLSAAQQVILEIRDLPGQESHRFVWRGMAQ